DTCSVTGNVIGSGRDNCSSLAVSNSASATCPVPTAPAIVVTLACPTTSITPGSLITYTGTVRNSGNITLNNVSVTDSQSTPPTVLFLATLAPGVTANFNASFNAPLDSCSVSSGVTARGTDACSAASVTNTASATCPIVTTP